MAEAPGNEARLGPRGYGPGPGPPCPARGKGPPPPLSPTGLRRGGGGGHSLGPPRDGLPAEVLAAHWCAPRWLGHAGKGRTSHSAHHPCGEDRSPYLVCRAQPKVAGRLGLGGGRVFGVQGTARGRRARRQPEGFGVQCTATGDTSLVCKTQPGALLWCARHSQGRFCGVQGTARGVSVVCKAQPGASVVCKAQPGVGVTRHSQDPSLVRTAQPGRVGVQGTARLGRRERGGGGPRAAAVSDVPLLGQEGRGGGGGAGGGAGSGGRGVGARRQGMGSRFLFSGGGGGGGVFSAALRSYMRPGCAVCAPAPSLAADQRPPDHSNQPGLHIDHQGTAACKLLAT